VGLFEEDGEEEGEEADGKVLENTLGGREKEEEAEKVSVRS